MIPCSFTWTLILLCFLIGFLLSVLASLEFHMPFSGCYRHLILGFQMWLSLKSFSYWNCLGVVILLSLRDCAGPCSLMPTVPPYCGAYFNDPFSYHLPPLSVYVVDRTIVSGMYFLSCLWQLCCSLYKHLLTSTSCVLGVLGSWNLFSKSFLVVLKHLSILGGMFAVSILNFPRKLLILEYLNRTYTKRIKDCAEGGTSSCNNVTVSRRPYTGLLDFWKDLTEMRHTSQPDKNDTR